jgi:hypothetical protein
MRYEKKAQPFLAVSPIKRVWLLCCHHGCKILDVLVLNATEFDVSDILAAQGDDTALKVHDPVSGITLPCIVTHETMDSLIYLNFTGEKSLKI